MGKITTVEGNMLSDLKCKHATCEGRKIRKLPDSGGLYLWVFANGKKYWRLRYRLYGKEKSLSLGVYGNQLEPNSTGF